LEQPVAAEIDDVRIVRREDERRVPVEAVGVARLRVDDVLARATASAAAAPAAAARRAAVNAGRRAAARTACQLRRRTGGRTNAHRLPRVQIVARGVAVLRLAVDDVRRVDVDRRVEAITAADAEPVHVGDATASTL